MNANADASDLLQSDDRLARRNALVLAVAQALAGGNNTVVLATGGILGAMLAPDRALATLPISIYVVGLWMGSLPFGKLARLFGRRTAFQIGTVCGVLTGFINYAAVMRGSFLILCVGTFVSGLYASAHLAYRFAAADTASEAFKPKAISWVLIGGVFAGIIGSQTVIFTQHLWAPYLFAATFLAQSGLAAISALVLVLVKIPRPPQGSTAGEGRSILEIARQPRFIVAVACGVASYAMMNAVMTSAPLAMVMCNHSLTQAALGMQWHVLGMYLPSFFTGSLIARFGVERIVAAGFVLLMTSAVVSMSGITVAHFWTGLILLGLGWNFSFIGATAMVTACHRPTERNRVQSFNDFLVFGAMAIGSFSSGTLLEVYGWNAVNEVVFPVVLTAGALLLWGVLRNRSPEPV